MKPPTKLVLLIFVEILIFAALYAFAFEWMLNNAVWICLFALSVIVAALASDKSWLDAFGKVDEKKSGWSDLAIEIQNDLAAFPRLHVEDDFEAHHKEMGKAMLDLEAKYIHRIRKSYEEIEAAYGVDLGQRDLRFVNQIGWSEAAGVLLDYGERQQTEKSEHR